MGQDQRVGGEGDQPQREGVPEVGGLSAAPEGGGFQSLCVVFSFVSSYNGDGGPDFFLAQSAGTERLSTLSSPSSSPALVSAPLPAPPSLLARHGLARSASEYAVAPAALSPSASFTGASTPTAAIPASTLTAHRLALNRGASAPAFSSVPIPVPTAAARSKGFPIAQARGTALSSSPAETVVPASGARKLRALPSRRAAVPVEAAGGVGGSFGTSSWVVGGGVTVSV